MPFLKKFASWASTRLRKSQMNILYQNIEAIGYLEKQFRTMQEVMHQGNPAALGELRHFRTYVESCIIELTYQDNLDDMASKQLATIGANLRAAYDEFYEGQRRFRQQMGQPLGDLVPYNSRFAPARSDGVSDVEWDRMVSNALRSATEDP